MSENRLPDYLDHIQQAATDARSFVEGMAKDDFLADKRTQQAVIMSLIVIGEAATKVMDGVVMGGGMGVAQAGPGNRLRIVTGRTRMAMPEVNIGLFPDVGGSYFLSRLAGQLGLYLGLTGLTINAADALYTDLADVYLPEAQMGALLDLFESTPGEALPVAIKALAAPFQAEAGVSALATARAVPFMTVSALYGRCVSML